LIIRSNEDTINNVLVHVSRHAEVCDLGDALVVFRRQQTVASGNVPGSTNSVMLGLMMMMMMTMMMLVTSRLLRLLSSE